MILGSKTTLHCYNWLGFSELQDTKRFLFALKRHVSTLLPPSGEAGTKSWHKTQDENSIIYSFSLTRSRPLWASLSWATDLRNRGENYETRCILNQVLILILFEVTARAFEKNASNYVNPVVYVPHNAYCYVSFWKFLRIWIWFSWNSFHMCLNLIPKLWASTHAITMLNKTTLMQRLSNPNHR
jgi:hypothetical protein